MLSDVYARPNDEHADTVNAQAAMVYTETRPLQEVNTLINTALLS